MPRGSLRGAFRFRRRHPAVGPDDCLTAVQAFRPTEPRSMHDRETPAPTPEAPRRPNAMTGWEGRRPTLRRFPLIAFLATGLICLNYLDGRLSNDHKRSAADLAVQADALIEGAVSYRAASVHELR